MVRCDHVGATAVLALDRVGEAVVDSGIDVHASDAAKAEFAFHKAEHPPDEPAPAGRRLDEDVVQQCVAARPTGTRDREADQAAPAPESRDDRPRVGELVPHLALGERAASPLRTLERQRALADALPRGLARREQARARRRCRYAVFPRASCSTSRDVMMRSAERRLHAIATS
jgi:hypothetical protein